MISSSVHTKTTCWTKLQKVDYPNRDFSRLFNVRGETIYEATSVCYRFLCHLKRTLAVVLKLFKTHAYEMQIVQPDKALQGCQVRLNKI